MLQNLAYLIAIGIMVFYIIWIYKFLLTIEPYCFYLPGGLNKFYKIHAHINTKFNDVIGCDQIKDELRLHLQFFQKKKLTKGFLFHGPSGTGKTMMARAIAGESNLPFIEIFTDNLQDVHIPTVINLVNHRYNPCIIFIDECSSILHNFSETFLRKLDGIESIENIFLVLATSKKVDPSIYRSGRIDKIINFQPPTYIHRKEMFKKMGFEELISSKFAEQTGSFTYADISIIPREIEFLKFSNKNISDDNAIVQIIERKNFGRNTSQFKLNNEISKRVAYHEIGHLFTAYLLKNVEKPNKISINPEGKFAGNVTFNSKDTIFKTYSDILKDITILLASSVFEKHYLGEYSTLCEHDFEKINELFQSINKNQMLGFNFLTISPENVRGQINKILDQLTTFIIEKVIINNKDSIEKLYCELLKAEILHQDRIETLLDKSLLNSLDLPNF